MIEASIPKRILLVDDEASLRKTIAKVLSRFDNEIEIATDGEDCLRKFREKKWDLVVTDQHMPGMSGEDVAAVIKAEAPEIPVILMTGVPDTVHNPQLFFALVIKPFANVELRDAVSNALSGTPT